MYRVKQKVHEVARDVPGLGSSSDSGSSHGGIMGSISKMVSGSGSSDGGGSGSSGTTAASAEIPAVCSARTKSAAPSECEIVATESTDGRMLLSGAGQLRRHDRQTHGRHDGDERCRRQDPETDSEPLPAEWPRRSRAKVTTADLDSNGNVPVFTFGVDNNAAEAQMRLNAKDARTVWVPVNKDIPGIGDQAFDEAGAMMMVRKGDKLIRIMYSTCPCSVEAIKPLAKTLADRL